MNNKKEFVFLVLSIFLISLVSAQNFGESIFDSINLGEGVRQIIDLAVEFIRPFFEILVGPSESISNFSENEVFLAKSLFLILLFIMIGAILKKSDMFKTTPQVINLISAIVSILAVRFFVGDSSFILGILLPYGTLGTALLLLLPFTIFFFGINFFNLGHMGRRIWWVVFGLIYLIFTIYSWSSFVGIVKTMYFLIIIAIILCFIFDRQIHSYFNLAEVSRFYRNSNDRRITRLQAEYQEIERLDTPTARRRRVQIMNELRQLGAELPG